MLTFSSPTLLRSASCLHPLSPSVGAQCGRCHYGIALYTVLDRCYLCNVLLPRILSKSSCDFLRFDLRSVHGPPVQARYFYPDSPPSTAYTASPTPCHSRFSYLQRSLKHLFRFYHLSSCCHNCSVAIIIALNEIFYCLILVYNFNLRIICLN